ncbi:ABC transporter ATP-binding protein [[Pseudopropionibacterium] massiliense]|uniref:iron ABC transporter ATP-binding protein n=1 Tax=[Pseudopropionibacterium] massiliense TaxID=2220000 RepID=UPI0010325206|nr:ATP-binding cassette domain-containing protein [[Pseudopropionibacterium] massiliense]
MILVDAALKKYSSTTTIGPLELEIPEGGITALVGPNGAGKSTLLTMIGRLLGMDAGTIEVAGMNVTTTKSRDLSKVLSVLRQENHFVTRLTVRQLVGFGRFPYSRGRLTVEDIEIVEQAISFLRLEEIADRFIDELSGGQRQRAYVAMVLAQDTRYVLLDEPLNNLDMAHSVQMMQHMHRAAKDLGRTIVIVLHDINFAATYADTIIAMKNGQVAASGSPKELFREEILTDIFETPVKIIPGPRGPVAAYF